MGQWSSHDRLPLLGGEIAATRAPNGPLEDSNANPTNTPKHEHGNDSVLYGREKGKSRGILLFMVDS